MQKSKLNIAVVMQSPDIGGAETFMVSLVDTFIKKGNKVIVASNKGKFFSLINEQKIETHEIPFVIDIIGNLRGLIKTILLIPCAFLFYSVLLREFKKDKVDVILMSNFTEKLFVTFLSPFFKIPVVWIEYGNLHKVFKQNFYIPKIIYRSLKKIPKAIIVPSENTMRSLIADVGISMGEISLVPLGIDELKAVTNKHEGIVIGSVSRITPEKGQEYLVRAMLHVIKKIPQAKLLIVGDGPSLNELKKLAKNLNLEKNIEFTGFVENVDKYYAQMDIFVFPSVWDLEGFGLVLIEAMNYHLPIIASKVGPIPEIVTDEITGILVDVKNEKEFSDEIISMANNPEKRKKMGDLGYEKFKKNYLLENTVEKIYNILYEAKFK